MTNKLLKFCFEQIVAPECEKIAAEKAIAENPANASPFEAAAVRSKLWSAGRTLSVSFLDGTSDMQAQVAHFAQQWCDYANVSFNLGAHADAEIRISFTKVGSWSAVGTDAMVQEFFAPSSPTMNFSWVDEAVVLHEFGHALGLIHEHQSPTTPIKWNEPAVIAYLAGPPNYWSEEQTRRNVFERYSVEQTQHTKFDPDSIMLYYFPKEFTLNGQMFKQNEVLSLQDREFIAECYPHSPR